MMDQLCFYHDIACSCILIADIVNGPDYARGEGLVSSSSSEEEDADEGEAEKEEEQNDSDEGRLSQILNKVLLHNMLIWHLKNRYELWMQIIFCCCVAQEVGTVVMDILF